MFDCNHLSLGVTNSALNGNKPLESFPAIQMMDVSLRDGGHRTNFHFTTSELHNMLVPLDKSGVEYIEIGYRNGSLHPIDDLGLAGFCHKDYLVFCQSLIQSATIAVMLHPKNVALADIQELKKYGVDLVRICVAKGGLSQALPVLEMVKSLGLQVSVNIIHLSYYKPDELDEVVETVSGYQPDMLYFADSNGSMFPSKIRDIYEKYSRLHSFTFGFHAHDNLGLAQVNVLAAIDGGARLIDASLAGMGKGTGNLKTEFFMACLQAGKVEKYNLQEALTAANYVRQNLGIGHEAIEMDEFIRGINDLSTADLASFKN